MAEAELDSFRIVGDTTIGWDANTPVNETVDDDGNFVGSGGFGVHDPRAPSERVYDHPEVQALREEYKKHNGF